VKRRDRPVLRAIVPIALMGVIFFLSAQPGADEGGWFVFVLRKLGHVTEYALLTGAWWWTLRGVVARPLGWAVGISLAFACTDEFHQTLVRGRDGTPRDVLIDAVGMAIAALVISRWAPRRRRRSSPRASPASSPS